LSGSASNLPHKPAAWPLLGRPARWMHEAIPVQPRRILGLLQIARALAHNSGLFPNDFATRHPPPRRPPWLDP
jgi:hypothetical protein